MPGRLQDRQAVWDKPTAPETMNAAIGASCDPTTLFRDPAGRLAELFKATVLSAPAPCGDHGLAFPVESGRAWIEFGRFVRRAPPRMLAWPATSTSRNGRQSDRLPCPPKQGLAQFTSRKPEESVDENSPQRVGASARMAINLLPNGTLKTYAGLPHGLFATHPDLFNTDRLAFITPSGGATPLLS